MGTWETYLNFYLPRQEGQGASWHERRGTSPNQYDGVHHNGHSHASDFQATPLMQGCLLINHPAAPHTPTRPTARQRHSASEPPHTRRRARTTSARLEMRTFELCVSCWVFRSEGDHTLWGVEWPTFTARFEMLLQALQKCNDAICSSRVQEV